MSETTQFANNGGSGGGTNLLKANAVLLSRYKVIGVLGGGGMGTVYQARDLHFPDTQRLVAVKEMQTMSNDSALKTSMLRTFQREANILATLNHFAIPKIFDFFDQNDRAYLVMEYINGSDLELLLQKTKDLPTEKIIEWGIDLCDVLNYLHSHEPDPIIFRDMKPSNVMIDSRGKVRLIDFGIAKMFQSGVKHTMIGTEGYSAPEQYKGDVTPLSDIYSLGATLHHVLTRKDPRLEPPFSFGERPILTLNPKTPPALADIVDRALSFDSKDRFQSCVEMKSALEQVLSRPASASVAPAPAAPAAQGAATRRVVTSAPDEPRTDFFDDVSATGAIQAKWVFKTEDEIRCSPLIQGDTAFVGSYDTNVWALTVEKGEFVWKFPTKGGIASSPVVDVRNKTVMFGSEDFSFYSVDMRTGRLSWKHQTEGRIRGGPRVAHEHVFFGSDDGHLYALNSANGRVLWRYDTGAPVRSRPYVTNELIILGSESGEIVGLELSGSRKWSVRTKRGVMSSPFVDMKEGMVYVGSADTYLYALDATNGYSSWRFRTNGAIISSPVVNENLVFFGSADGFLYAVNTQTGKERWKYKTDKPIVSSPIVAKDAVYFGGTDDYLYCLEVDTGRERWKFKTSGPITSAPYAGNGVILVGSMDHTLYALPLVT